MVNGISAIHWILIGDKTITRWEVAQNYRICTNLRASIFLLSAIVSFQTLCKGNLSRCSPQRWWAATPQPSHLLSSGQASELAHSLLRSSGLARFDPLSPALSFLLICSYSHSWSHSPHVSCFRYSFCFMIPVPNPCSEPRTPICSTSHHIPLVLFLFPVLFLTPCLFPMMLSSHSKNSISKMNNGQMWRSGMKSGCLGSEWVGVGGTWLQLMCCAVSHHRVPNFGRRGLDQRLEIRRWLRC